MREGISILGSRGIKKGVIQCSVEPLNNRQIRLSSFGGDATI